MHQGTLDTVLNRRVTCPLHVSVFDFVCKLGGVLGLTPEAVADGIRCRDVAEVSHILEWMVECYLMYTTIDANHFAVTDTTTTCSEIERQYSSSWLTQSTQSRQPVCDDLPIATTASSHPPEPGTSSPSVTSVPNVVDSMITEDVGDAQEQPAEQGGSVESKPNARRFRNILLERECFRRLHCDRWLKTVLSRRIMARPERVALEGSHVSSLKVCESVSRVCIGMMSGALHMLPLAHEGPTRLQLHTPVWTAASISRSIARRVDIIRWMCDGQRIVVGSKVSNHLEVFTPESARRVNKMLKGANGSGGIFDILPVSQHRNLVMGISRSGTLPIWDLRAGNSPASIMNNVIRGEGRHISEAADMTQVYVGSSSGNLSILDLRSMRRTLSVGGSAATRTSIVAELDLGQTPSMVNASRWIYAAHPSGRVGISAVTENGLALGIASKSHGGIGALAVRAENEAEASGEGPWGTCGMTFCETNSVSGPLLGAISSSHAYVRLATFGPTAEIHNVYLPFTPTAVEGTDAATILLGSADGPWILQLGT